MFRRVIETILITLIQIVGIFFVHYIFYSNYPMRHKEVGFGIAIYFTGIIFIVLLFIYNLLLEFYNHQSLNNYPLHIFLNMSLLFETYILVFVNTSQIRTFLD